MVEVATAMDLPNKLVMPALFSTTQRASLLGLGDVIIPGLYLSYLDRLGRVLNTDAYFLTGMVAYALSFVQCGVVIAVFDSA